MTVPWNTPNFASFYRYKYSMHRLLTAIIIISLAANYLRSQSLSEEVHNRTVSLDKEVKTVLPEGNTAPAYVNGNGFDESGNRLPQLLRDVKVYLSDAIIADVHQDTLEVIYNLDRIFELLAEADQLGEMTLEDQEEFDRFETSLIDVYTHRLTTLKTTDVPFTAEQLRREVTEYIEPLEVEMGNSKFTVIDDRDGHIPLVRNEKVDQFIKFFQTKGRKQFNIWLSRYAVYGDMIRSILRDHGLPEELVFLSVIESGLNPKAYSRANAVGLWQFIYTTGKKYGLNRTWYLDERRDPVKSTNAACYYLKDLYQEFDHWYLVLAAYNAGSGRVARATRLHQTSDFWQLHSLPRETRNFVPYFLAVAIIGQNPEEFGFKMPKTTPFSYAEVELEKSADLNILAQAAGISLKTLQRYNPELRQSATPADGPYKLKLPPDKKDIFLANFNALPENQRFAPQYIVHRVRRGESLWSIAKKYNISIHDLASVNKIRNRHKIRVGQKLTVPVRGTGSRTLYARAQEPAGHVKVVYTVKKGDTLGHIAQGYRTRASKIRRWNGLKYGEYIYPGQKLVVWVKEG